MSSSRLHFHSKNRSAQIFTIGVVLIVIAALTSAYFLINSKYIIKTDAKNLPVGAKPLAIIETYQDAESALLYLDRSASYALQDSLVYLAEHAGFPIPDASENDVPSGEVTFPCGDYIYPLWNTADVQCFPDQAKNLKATFATVLDSRLSLYTQKTEFPDSNYELGLSEDSSGLLTMRGSALDSIEFIIGVISAQAPPAAQGAALQEIKSMTACTASDCRLKPDAAAQLQKTITNLRANNIELVITSAHRDIAQQQELYNQCSPNCGGRVARPNPGAPHIVGWAIDIRMLQNGIELQTGPSGPDDAYSTHTFSAEQLKAQKKVEDIMCDQGWVRFKDEWWHFEYATARWQAGQDKNVCAI